MKAEIQNQYLLYVLLLEVSLSLTSLKCFWLEAAEDTGLLLTQILSTPFVDSACTVTQHIDVKACLNCRLLVSITTTVFAFFCKIWNMAWIFITALVSCFQISSLTTQIIYLYNTLTHYTFHHNRQIRNDNQLLLTIFLSHIMTHK